uniref:Uncharacterized protein n=1 Tax=Myoviridae sp. ctCo31 TaxID=2825053 RepID=A0A8S5UMQ2_9CAUD|nr:MAG TPA: hypothetical protein [Myoviridae sp. ctCo31]
MDLSLVFLSILRKLYTVSHYLQNFSNSYNLFAFYSISHNSNYSK